MVNNRKEDVGACGTIENVPHVVIVPMTIHEVEIHLENRHPWVESFINQEDGEKISVVLLLRDADSEFFVLFQPGIEPVVNATTMVKLAIASLAELTVCELLVRFCPRRLLGKSIEHPYDDAEKQQDGENHDDHAQNTPEVVQNVSLTMY